MFSHTHIANGSSIVHSHLGGGSEHSHSDSQYAVIDILSNFQSEGAVDFYSTPVPVAQVSELSIGYLSPLHLSEVRSSNALRGPPQE